MDSSGSLFIRTAQTNTEMLGQKIQASLPSLGGSAAVGFDETLQQVQIAGEAWLVERLPKEAIDLPDGAAQ